MATYKSTAQDFRVVKDGEKGDTGLGVSDVKPYYAVGASSTTAPSTPSTDTWSKDTLTPGSSEYLWCAWLTIYSDDTTSWTEPYCVTDVTTRERVTTLETELTVVQGQITSKVWQTDIDTAVTDLEGEITTIQDQYTTVNQTVDGLVTQVGDIQTTVSDNYESLSSQISTVETTATKISSTVSDLQTTMTDNYTDLSDKISDVEQTASSISMSVSNVQSKIDNLEVGGRNLVVDSRELSTYYTGDSFDTETTYTYLTDESGNTLTDEDGNALVYDVSTSTDATAWTQGSEDDYGYLEIITTSTDLDSVAIPLYTVYDELTGSVTISFEYSESAEGLLLFDFWAMSDSGLIADVGSYVVASEFTEDSTVGSWTRVHYTFDVDSVNGQDATAYAIQFIKASSKTGTASVRKPKLEIGTVATDWTPAPEDMATQESVDTAQETANTAYDTASSAVERVSSAELTIDGILNQISMLVTDSNGTSLMTQTSDGGWTFSMSQTQATLDSISSSLDGLQNSYGDTESTVSILQQAVDDLESTAEYIRITTYEDEPCIELGESDSDFKLLITNTRIMFQVGSDVPTYISNTGLITENIVVNNNLQQGNYVWSVRSNGNYGLRYVG